MSETKFPMTPDHDLSEDDEAVLDAQAEADVDAGRFVPHAEVVQWLESWGTANELPCPEPKSH